MPHDLYICYSNRDAAVADAVCAALEASGLRCWIAPRDVLPGMAWADAVLDAITQSRLVVLIFSSRANKSPHVTRDVERVESIGIPLIPFRIEDVPPSNAFAYFLESCDWLDAATPPLDSHLPELVEAAHRILFSKKPRLPDDQTGDFTKATNYDVFISYRRERGAAEARVIRSELRERKLRAFLDVDDLRAGHFDEALLRRIEETPNFILILSPNSLDRCTDERDWLRQEIAHALKTERNIIPIMLSGFKFPDREALPHDLRDLPTHNGLEWSHKYFAAMIADIVMYLRTENSRPIVANADSAVRDSAAAPEFSPTHTASAEEGMHSSESALRQTPAPSSPIETASPGKAATSDTVATGQPVAVTSQTSKETTQPEEKPGASTGGSSLPKFAEIGLTVLAVLGISAFAGLIGHNLAAPLVGFIISLVKGLRPNESQKLVEDLRSYCGFGLMAIAFVGVLVVMRIEKGKKQ